MQRSFFVPAPRPTSALENASCFSAGAEGLSEDAEAGAFLKADGANQRTVGILKAPGGVELIGTYLPRKMESF